MKRKLQDVKYGNTISFFPYVLALCMYIALAFFFHLFLNTVSGLVYAVVVLVFIAIYLVTNIRPVVYTHKLKPYYLAWFAAIAVIALNYLIANNKNSVLMDIIIFTCGLLLMLCARPDSRQFETAMKMIVVIALFFAFGVYLQLLLPGVYKGIVGALPSALSHSISRGVDEGASSIRGFTTNSGFTAGYIGAGILALVPRLKNSTRNKIILAILILAVLFTGKRGPILFYTATIAFCYLLPNRGSKKIKKYIVIFIVVLILIGLFILLGEQFKSVPIIGKVYKTIEGITSGKDVTSGRGRLYAWAWQQFCDNPIFGIGWTKYRETTAGVASYNKDLDVHDVYLQLLCETGVVGFTVFMTLFISSWIIARKNYKSCALNPEMKNSPWKPLLYFSIAFQTYFLLYAITGNPLYDQFYQIMYVFACTIGISYRSYIKLNQKKKETI